MMKKRIVISPLEMYQGNKPQIIHSDRGSQYRSHEYRDLLEKEQIIHSMSEPGTPVDNAVIESFHKSIKRELVYPNKHRTKSEMRILIQDYLMDYYVDKRIHTKFNMILGKYEQLLGQVT